MINLFETFNDASQKLQHSLYLGIIDIQQL